MDFWSFDFSTQKAPSTSSIPTVSLVSEKMANDFYFPPDAEKRCLLHALLLEWKLVDKEVVLEIHWSYPEPIESVKDQSESLKSFLHFQIEDVENSFETFTFVQTSSNSERTYLHGIAIETGQAAMCITKYPWCNFFYCIGNFLLSASEEDRKKLLNVLCTQPIPPPGQCFQIENDLQVCTRRPCDQKYAFIDTFLENLLHIFPDVEILFDIISSMLLERRILIVGTNIPILSKVMMSLQAVFSPFKWMYPFFLITSERMVGFLDSPTPYLIGTLPNYIPKFDESHGLFMIKLNDDGICKERRIIHSKHMELPKTKALEKLRANLSSITFSTEKSAETLCGFFWDYYIDLYLRLYYKRFNVCQMCCGTKDSKFCKKLMKSGSMIQLSKDVQKCCDSLNDSWMENAFFLELLKRKPSISHKLYRKLKEKGMLASE